MTEKILVLGAGAAGSVVTNKLAREFRQEIAKDEVEITIMDKNDMNINQGGFTFIPFGLYTPEDISRPRKKVISPRVKMVFGEDGEVERVDLGDREVTAKSGKKYPYDYLVLATGCSADVERDVLNKECEILNPKHQILNNIKIQNPKKKVCFEFRV